jgi:deoxyguanosine kinase
MGDLPFISVEGPIGVGKTSLSKKLASQFDFHLLKEIVEENPFLGKFYDNIEEWSFQTEMFFLCNRFKQLEDIDRQYLQLGKPVVADYHISKNMIFARRTLREEQFDKYAQIFDILTHDMPKPNMVVYLHASLDTLLERIRMRNRDVEANIQPSYLEQLSKDYEDFNPEVVTWGLSAFDLRIHDTWWMTETGGMLICNYPAMDMRPGLHVALSR